MDKRDPTVLTKSLDQVYQDRPVPSHMLTQSVDLTVTQLHQEAKQSGASLAEGENLALDSDAQAAVQWLVLGMRIVDLR